MNAFKQKISICSAYNAFALIECREAGVTKHRSDIYIADHSSSNSTLKRRWLKVSVVSYVAVSHNLKERG